MNTASLRIPEHPALWRGNSLAPARPGIATGFPGLDVLLPGGGWPVGGLTEIFVPRHGIGEISLLMPALSRLSQEESWLTWVAPPYLPYAPALAQAGIDLKRTLIVRPESESETVWSIRQALLSHSCSAVLGWLDRTDTSSLRRLQLAAESSHSSVFLFRPAQAAYQASPAALKLYLEADGGGLAVHVLKRRGTLLPHPVRIDLARPTQEPARAMSMDSTTRTLHLHSAGNTVHALARPASSRPAAASPGQWRRL